MLMHFKKSAIVATLCLILTTLPALAQSSSVKQAQAVAQSLANQETLPVNVRLRFQILEDQLPLLAGKQDPSSLLRFFSTSRILFWNEPASQNASQSMQQFESLVVGLSKERGISLDVPPVGYSSNNYTTVSPQPVGGGLLAGRLSRTDLELATLRAEEAATFAIQGGQSSQQLQALRDAFTVLRQDLADDTLATVAVRNALQARVVYLAGDASNVQDAELKSRLDIWADGLRATITPATLRAASGQQIRI